MAVQNNGGEFQEYQSAQNQLLNIQAQQMQNLNEQRVMAQADASTNNVLYQASGLMADNMMNNTQEAANFNPQTQAILNQYGLGQPRMQRSSSSSSQSTSKQNITINNNYKTENTTTNNVTVPSGGPIQGRPVTIGDNGIGKFKVWLNTTFAQQQEAAAKRDREYEIRQSSLSKENNKILRKLETVGTNVGKALDPRRVTQAIQNPMKMLLTTLGIVTIAQNFPKIVDFADDAQKFFKKAKDFFTEPGSKLAEFFGGEKGETPQQAIKGLFEKARDEVRAYLDKEFKKRGEAIKHLESGITWEFGEGLENNIKGIGKHLFNLIKITIDPASISSNKAEIQQAAEEDINVQRLDPSQSDYIRKNKKAIDRQNKVEVIDKNGNRFRGRSKGVYGSWKLSPTENISGANKIEHITQKPMVGDRNILNLDDQGAPVYEGLPGYSITNTGDLSSTIGAQIAAGQEIIRLFKTSNKDAINTAAIAQQLARLVKPLNENGEVVISDYFKKFFEKDPFGVKDFAEKYDKNNLLYAIDNNNRIVLIDKKNKNKYDYVLEDSPANEGQELYKVTSEGFQKILQALAGTKSYNGGDWNLTTDIKSTDVNFQNKLHNKLSKLGVKVTSPYYLYTENTSSFNNIMSYEYAVEDIENEYKKWKQENGFKSNQAQSQEVDNVRYDKEENANVEEKKQKNTKDDSGSTEKLSEEQRIKKALNFFLNDKELGLTEDQAKALVANLIAESALKPKPHENDNFNAPEGIAQWVHKGRKKKLLELFNKKYETTYESISDMSLDDQLKLVKLELLEGEYKSFLNNLKNNSFNETPIDSVDAFARGYELGGGGGQLASMEKCNDKTGNYNKHYNIRKGHYDYLTNLLNQQESTQIASTITPRTISTTAYNFRTDTTDFQNISTPEKTTTQEYIVESLDKLYVGLDKIHQTMAVINENMIKGNEKNVQATLSSSSSPNIQQEQQWTA